MIDPGPSPVARLALLFLLLAIAVVLATEHLARPWTIEGSSMEPTLGAGERVLVDLWTYRRRPPRPGEIVLFGVPGAGETTMVKRVARRGDDGSWVLGDNPRVSTDSRSFGAVGDERMIGRVFFRYWPAGRAGVPAPSAPDSAGRRRPAP